MRILPNSAGRNTGFALITLFLVVPTFVQAATPQFTEIAANLGLSNPGFTYTLAADDFDGDGDIDVFEGNLDWVSPQPSRLYENDGTGHFTVVPNTPFPYTYGSCWFDMDADGDLDAITWYNGLKCFENIGDLQFADVTSAVGLADIDPFHVEICDYDGDSWLDVVVSRQGANSATEIWCRRGSVYVQEHAFASPTSTPTSPVDVVSAFDWDRDLDPDLLVRDFGAYWGYDSRTYVSVNQSGVPAAFTPTSIPNFPAPWSTFAWTDVDLDGDWDFYCSASDYHGGANHLIVQTGPGVWTDSGGTAGLWSSNLYTSYASWGDFDLDGYPDIFEPRFAAYAGYTTSRLYHNNGNVTFTDITSSLNATIAQYVVPTVWLDVDTDGDLDLLVGRSGDHNGPSDAAMTTNMLFRNDTTGLGHWLQVDLQGNGGNRFGRGAEVTVFAGGRQLLTMPCGGSAPGHSNNPHRMTIGLAEATVADSVIVRWRSGIETRLYDIPGDQLIRIVEVEMPPRLSLVDVTDDYPGLDDYGSGSSVAWLDYDSDGDLDLSVGAGANNINRFFLNRVSENGGVSFEMLNEPLIANQNTTRGLAWGIFNPGDSCPDLYQGVPYAANVMINNSCGDVVDVTNSVTIGTSDETNGIRVVDFDRDGLLDIHELRPHSADRLLKNLGNWQFEEMPSSAINIVDGSFDAAWGDVDSDGDQDVYVTREDPFPNVLLRNDGEGVFTDVTPAPLAIVERSQGATWGDYDNDGDLDLFVTNWLAGTRLFRNDGGLNFVDVTVSGMDISRRGQSAIWGDLNNDGWLDLYVTSQGDPNQLWLNVPDGQGGRSFEDVTYPAVADLGMSTGAGFGDYDLDGDLDIYVGVHLGSNKLFRNDLASGNHWLQVKLVGTQSNASAIGSRLTLSAGGLTMIREVGANNGMWSQEPFEQHFGLGPDTGPVYLTVRWPSGAVSDTTIATVDQLVKVTEPLNLPPTYAPACLTFDGADDYVATPAISLPSGSSDRTLEFWVKSSDFAQGGDRAIAGWGATNTNQYCAIALGHDNAPTRKLFFWGWFNDLYWSTPLADDMWYHVAFTLQSNVASLYLNGVLEYTGAVPPLNTAANSSFRLCDNANISQRFGGSLDEVRVWDRALTGEEINGRMYSCLDASAETGLVLYWQLNEGFGAVAHDLSGRGSHGYIAGAAWNEDSHPVRIPFAIGDKAADQGGYLDVTWRGGDAGGQSCWGTITSYAVQRLSAGEWMPVAQVEATAAESYQLSVGTQDVFTVGQPAPYSRYRLVASTTDPNVFIYSDVDSAYSIDNLPPPKPIAILADELDSRMIIWTRPTIPDLGTACVYRGSEAGFTAGEPIACPTTRSFEETDLGWYFYRVQFTDIHGNVSEFSDELHGQWPTPVPSAMPHALKLYPCQPNPFNPQTTVKYDLPAAGPVRLTVFDVAGRLVRTLVDESMPQGSHEAVWDGRDSSGRAVGSGSYLARLEFGGKVEVVRMGLVR